MKKRNLDRLIKRVLSEKKLNLNEETCYCSTDGSKVNISGCNPCTQECCKEAGYDEVWSGSAVRGGTKRGKGKGMRAKLQKEQFINDIKMDIREMEELNEAPVCWYRRRNYANAGYTCVARRCGFSAPHKAFHPGEYDSEEDCKGSIAPPVGPGGVDDMAMAMDFDRGDKNPMGKATHVPAIPMGGGSGFGPGGIPTKPVRGRGSKATHTMWRCIAGKCTNKHGLIGGHFHTREACEKWCNRDKTPRVNN